MHAVLLEPSIPSAGKAPLPATGVLAPPARALVAALAAAALVIALLAWHALAAPTTRAAAAARPTALLPPPAHASPAPVTPAAALAPAAETAAATVARTRSQGVAQGSVAAAATNAFAIALYRRLAGAPGNLLFSPYSLSSALDMAATGARGATAKELTRVLGYPGDADIAREQDALAEAMRDSAAASSAEFINANGLWTSPDERWDPGFLATCRQRFAAIPDVLDFTNVEASRQVINDWAASHTRGRIADLLGPGSLTPDMALVIANALFLRLAWEKPFDAVSTSMQPFAAPQGPVSVPLMATERSIACVEETTCLLARLPYRGASFELVLLLPKDPGLDALARLESRLDASRLAQACADATPQLITLELPRFTIETPSLHLIDALRDIGLACATSSAADFSGMGPEGLRISTVEHKAMLVVDELGTEATAASALGAPLMLVRDFRFDRPFLFALRHVPSGAMLMLGRLVDPSP